MNKEPVVIPPGIVSVKDTGGFIWYSARSEMGYNEFVRWHLHLNSTIHTIEVEGRQWSVGEGTNRGMILSFIYKNDSWSAETKRIQYSTIHLVSQLTKLPSTPQPGEKIRPNDMNAAIGQIVGDYGTEKIMIGEAVRKIRGLFPPPQPSEHPDEEWEILRKEDPDFWKEGAFKNAIEKNLLANMLIEVLADIRRKPNDTRYATVTKKANELLLKLKCDLEPRPSQEQQLRDCLGELVKAHEEMCRGLSAQLTIHGIQWTEPTIITKAKTLIKSKS